MSTRRFRLHTIGSLALLGALSWNATARANEWVQIGKGIFASDAQQDKGNHHQSGRLAQVSWVPLSCGFLGCGPYELWAGASHGGLWGGIFDESGFLVKWVPVTDNFPPHTLGSFAVRAADPQLDIVIGTGAFVWGKGDGIHYTTDGGSSWHAANQPSIPARVSRLVSDSFFGSGFLLAATSDGIWRSNDFGQNWVSRLAGVEATDVVQDTENASRFYAGVVNKGIYLSTDSGKTWNPFGTGIEGSAARISLASCPFHKDILYAIVVKEDNKLNGVYRSSDRGSTWTKIYWDDAAINPDEQGLHTCSIACNPGDPDNIVFGLAKIASVANAKADPPVKADVFDGGHDDYNFIQFTPVSPGGVILANDGGFYFSDGRNVNDSANLLGLNNLELGQPKTAKGSSPQGGLASSYLTPDVFVAGLQDNGVVRGNVANDPALTFEFGGDGRHVSIMPASDQVFGFNANGSNVRHLTIDGGTSVTGFDFELTAEKSSPVLIDPTPGIAKPRVFTTDQLALFGPPSNFVFYDDVFSPTSWKAVSDAEIPGPGVISNADVVVDPDVREIVATVAGETGVWAYIGRRDQLGSLPLSDISPSRPGSPVKPDARINADRSGVQPQTLYYTSGMGHYTVSGQNVRLAYASRDGGKHWLDLTGDIATVSGDANLLKLIGNPGNQAQYFLATTKGVFRSDDLGIHWKDYSNGLRHHEEVDDIVINFDAVSGNPTLYVATHGRGFWRRTIE